MLRKWGSMVAAGALFASSTVAIAGTDAQQQGALAPGDAAGVQQAAGMDSDTTMFAIGTTFFIVGLCVVLCEKGKSKVTPTTTTANP